MASQINYEDNLYHLSMTLRQLRNGIGLDIDPEFFLQKTVNDILYHDNILGKLYQSLIKNTFLIRRNELLRLIMLAKKELVRFIDEIPTIHSGFALELQPFMPQLQQCRDRNDTEALDIIQILDGPAASISENGDIISQDEYKFLFQHDAESDIV